jgi:uncharacterized protein YgiM (DUF1202 family)
MTRILFVFAFTVIVLAPVFLGAQENTPKEGVLTGDKVRVRTGPGTNHKILIELRKGTKILVLTKEKDWYKIQMPGDVILWVSKNYIKEIKDREGLTGEINAKNVNVRTGIGTNDVKVGQVNKGDKVRIIGSKQGWYKIRPPKGFTAYIFAKYVNLKGTAGTTQEPGENGESTASTTTQKSTYEQRLEKLRQKIKILENEAKKIQKVLDEEKKKENELEEKLRKAEELVEGYKAAKDEINRKYQAILEVLKTGSKPKAKYTAEGYVEDIGRLFNPPPAEHRLLITRGSEPRYYLRSADASIDLDNYLRKRVGVVGEVVKEKWGDKEIEIIKVITIAILED